MNPAARVPIGVEDVNAYRDLARRFGVKDDNAQLSAQVFLALASKVDPLALGNVERSYNQIRKLAEDLLRLHTKAESDKDKVSDIVKILTERLYSHAHLINRREASRLGLRVEIADKALDSAQWELFSEYSTEMELDRPFNAPQLLGDQTSMRVELKRAFIESRNTTDLYLTEGTITRPTPGTVQLPPGIQLPPGMQAIQVAFQIESDGWKVAR